MKTKPKCNKRASIAAPKPAGNQGAGNAAPEPSAVTLMRTLVPDALSDAERIERQNDLA